MLTLAALGALVGAGQPPTALRPEILVCLRRFADDKEPAKQAWQELQQMSQRHSREAGEQQVTAHAQLLLANEFVRGLLESLVDNFFVIVPLNLIPGLRFTLFAEHDSSSGLLRLQVGSAASYHAEILLPPGTRFSARFRPTSETLAENLWRYQRSRDLLAIHVAPTETTATVEVDLRDAIRASDGFVSRAKAIVSGTTALFFGGIVARALGAHPDITVATPLLVALPAMYAFLLLEESRLPIQESVTRAPRRALEATGIFTFFGACALVVTLPAGTFAGLSYRAAAWCAASVGLLVTSLVALWRGRDW
jgi:hypothetical protein